MPSRKIENQLDALAAVRRNGASSEANAMLRKSLADPAGLVIAKAAEIAAELRATSLVPELLKAYDRLFTDGPKRDQQCWGKIAIAIALKDLDHAESEAFVRAFAYQQWEAVWGTKVDTAGPLRAVCNLAIVQCTDLLRDDKLWHLMRGLTDAVAAVRLEATRALEQIEGREAALLLRLKARLGDKEVMVTGQALQSVLVLEGEAALPFVREFIDQPAWPVQDQELMEYAALALGASRLPKALHLLMMCWKERRIGSAGGEAVLRALSSSRQEQALDFLLTLVSDGRQNEAVAALEALGLHQDSASIRARVETAVASRDNTQLHLAFQQAFR